MNKDYRSSSIQLPPHMLEVNITRPSALTVIRVDADAVCTHRINLKGLFQTDTLRSRCIEW